MELIILLTIFTYGSNLLLYVILKGKKKMKVAEKASIFFGVNMSVLLLNGIFAFIGKFIMMNEWLVLE